MPYMTDEEMDAWIAQMDSGPETDHCPTCDSGQYIIGGDAETIGLACGHSIPNDVVDDYA